MFWANMSSSWLDFFDAAGISEDPNAQTMLDDLDDQGGSATGFTDTSHLPLDLDRSPACIMSQHLESGRTVQVLQASSRENSQGSRRLVSGSNPNLWSLFPAANQWRTCSLTLETEACGCKKELYRSAPRDKKVDADGRVLRGGGSTFTEERKEVLNFIGLLLREFVNPRYPHDSICFPHFFRLPMKQTFEKAERAAQRSRTI